jgi:hypothetical protein
MSRSRRKTPITAITLATSDKLFKTTEHRRERRATHTVLGQTHNGDDRRLHAKVFGDPWQGRKEGKGYCPDDPKVLRK